MLREVEGFIKKFNYKNKDEKVLFIMQGAGVSFRSNFDMVEYKDEKVVNHIFNMGFKGGGHPSACGCGSTDEKFSELYKIFSSDEKLERDAQSTKTTQVMVEGVSTPVTSLSL